MPLYWRPRWRSNGAPAEPLVPGSQVSKERFGQRVGISFSIGSIVSAAACTWARHQVRRILTIKRREECPIGCSQKGVNCEETEMKLRLTDCPESLALNYRRSLSDVSAACDVLLTSLGRSISQEAEAAVISKDNQHTSNHVSLIKCLCTNRVQV